MYSFKENRREWFEKKNSENQTKVNNIMREREIKKERKKERKKTGRKEEKKDDGTKGSTVFVDCLPMSAFADKGR